MQALSNKAPKKSGLVDCLSAPGVVAEALEQLTRGEAPREAFVACIRSDPVLALRVSLLEGGYDAHPDLLRCVLLAAPVAVGPAQAA